ncbi:MAG: PadR family transcriptional regulator [Acidimicrobiales bacterium]
MFKTAPPFSVDDMAPASYRKAALLLLVAEAPGHGYALLDRLGAVGAGGRDHAATYRSLRAMERDGLVMSCWTGSKVGPARRTYHLTEAGRRELHVCARTVRETEGHMATFLDRYLGLAQGSRAGRLAGMEPSADPFGAAS